MKNTKLIGVILFILLGLFTILSVKFLKPYLKEKKIIESSDAKRIKGEIKIGMDNWAGYFYLCCETMQKKMYQSGYKLQCIDDKANYEERMKNLSKGNLHFAVATVDSTILNGALYNFPGVIILVIDESKGGDALVAREEKIKSIEELKTKPFKLAYTPSSPSEHLIKSIAAHFDIIPLQNLKGKEFIKTNGSSEALEKLLLGKVDVSAIWEPDVSKALETSGIIKLLGTDQTNKLIVDVLLVKRDFGIDHPEIINLLLSNYFRTLKEYKDNQESLKKDLASYTNISKDKVETLIKGISWANLNENATLWFGISSPGSIAEEGLIHTIESTVDILISSNDFSKNPLPNSDPYRIVNSKFIEELYLKGLIGTFTTPTKTQEKIVNSLETKFSPLDDAGWNSLKEVGTLKIRPITFQTGVSELNLNGKQELDKIIATISHYPNFRILIKGHTNTQGDKEANKLLSQERAEAVARYLEITHKIDPNRIKAIGYGGEKPLPRLPDETDRAYSYRLQRVEITLVTEEY